MTPRTRLLRQLWLLVFSVLVIAALAPRVRAEPARYSTPSSLVVERPHPIASRAPEQAGPRRVAIRRNAPAPSPRTAAANGPEPPAAAPNGRYLYLIHEALLC